MADAKSQPKLDAASCAPACIVIILAPSAGLIVIIALALFIFLGGVGSWLSGGQPGNQGGSNLTYPSGQSPQTIGQCLDAYMQSVVPSSPLIGKGVTFATAGQSYNVNPALMVAIGQQESALGTAGIVNSHPYNYYGLTAAGGGWAEFSSWEEAINNQARYLRTNYLDQGLTTIPQIGAKYAPVGASNDPNNLNSNWVTGVENKFNSIIGLCPALSQAPTGGTGNGSIVAIAQSQIGVSESYDNCNCGEVTKYGGATGQPWCAYFVSWVYRQAGYNMPSIGGAKVLYDWFGANQIQIPKSSGGPEPGDIIYFSYGHVGIVESFENGIIHTIEGNVSSHSVARRNHSFQSSEVVGFGRWRNSQ